MTRILVAHEMDLVTQGAHHVITTNPSWTVVSECHTLSDVVSLLASETVDILVCSEQLDPLQDIVTVIKFLRATAPDVRIILIGATNDGRLMRDMFHMGLSAYLHSGDPLRECLPAAIYSAIRGTLYLSPTSNAEYIVSMQTSPHHWQIDEEARTVLRLLAAGGTVNTIAAEMKVQRRHVYWVLEKLRYRFGALTNTQMVSYAIAEGYTSPPE